MSAGGPVDARVLTATGQTADGGRCWRSFGVWGDARPRCAALDRVVHCRDCEVFQAAGLELFDRELPDAYGGEWAEALATQMADERVPRTAVLIFDVGGELMALPLDAVVEIAEWRPIHSLPHKRDPVLLGVVNVGGELRLCASLGALFGDASAPRPGQADRGRLIVIGEGKPEWIVVADAALSVHRAALDAIEPPPATVDRSAVPFLRGIFTWRGRQVALLDAELVLAALRRRVS
jgi:chemotaxis-related protein WspD